MAKHADPRRRIPFRRPVHVRPVGGGPARRLYSSNLSVGGLFVRTPLPFPEGTQVEVLLEARGRALPFCRGQVTWTRHVGKETLGGRLPGFGLRFTSFHRGGQALVEHLTGPRGATARKAQAPVQVQLQVQVQPPAGPDTLRTASRPRIRLLHAAAAVALVGLGGLLAALLPLAP